MEPWYDPEPEPLGRAYCIIKEVFHTQESGARFEVVMSAEQQAAFETALVEDFDSIARWMCARRSAATQRTRSRSLASWSGRLA